MERALNPRLEADTIYEIYRSCRLCGAGAGYKMPIIQNVVLDESGVELTVKIRECLQIKVHQDDKMPPLICELCVDKVNDFYEFLNMCKQTNTSTRTKLGLPVLTEKTVGNSDNSCILGVTEPITVKDESDDDKPISKKDSKKKHTNQKDSKKKDSRKDVPLKLKTVKIEDEQTEGSMLENSKRVTRSKPDVQDVALNQLMKLTKSYKNILKNVKTETGGDKREKNSVKFDNDDGSLLVPRLKRLREVNLQLLPSPKKPRTSETPVPRSILKKTIKIEKDDNVRNLPQRKVKVTTKEAPAPEKSLPYRTTRNSLSCYLNDESDLLPKRNRNSYQPESDISTPRSSITPENATSKKVKKKPETKSKKSELKYDRKKEVKKEVKSERFDESDESFVETVCTVCNQVWKTSKAFSNHMRTHTPTFTNPKLSCNACRLWFVSSSEATVHNNSHLEGLPYKCERCTAEYKSIGQYNEHFKDDCIPFDEVPDVKCEDCWRYFATDNLLIHHNCPGEDGRPGGKCVKCNRKYVLLKNLKQHEENCSYKVRICGAIVDSEIKARLMQAQIRICRCDRLLENMINGHYLVSDVDDDFGLDKSCFYPYSKSARSLRLKNEPLLKNDNMVNITQDLPEPFTPEADNIRWDSDTNSSETTKNKLTEFDANEKEFDISTNIDNLIDNLDRDNRLSDKEKSAMSDYDCKSLDSADSASLLATKSYDEITENYNENAKSDSDLKTLDIENSNTILNSKVNERSTNFDIDSLLSNKTDLKDNEETAEIKPMEVVSEPSECTKNGKVDSESEFDSVKVSCQSNGVNTCATENRISLDDLLDSKKMELDDISNDDFNFDV